MTDCNFCDGSGKIQIYTKNTVDWLDPNDWGLLVSLREQEIVKSLEDWHNLLFDMEMAVGGSGEVNCRACN